MGQMIREARKKRGWTLKETADKIGISVSTLSYWQDGRSKADWERVCATFPELKSKTKKYHAILDEYRKSAIDCDDLKAKRLGARLSQRQMAKLINTSVATYQLWESGERKPNQKNQKKLKEALKELELYKRVGITRTEAVLILKKEMERVERSEESEKQRVVAAYKMAIYAIGGALK